MKSKRLWAAQARASGAERNDMKPFMDKDFLLHTETAKRLYHDVAAKCPIIDYHCHLSPKEIAEDKRFSSITELSGSSAFSCI